MLAALLSIALFDYLFVQPIFTFAVADLRYILTFGMMLVTALVISGFTLRIREQAESARQRERRTASLYALSRDLADTRTRADIVQVARRHLADTFECSMQILAPDPDGTLDVLAPAAPEPRLAIAGAGRRDLPIDQDLPVVVRIRAADGTDADGTPRAAEPGFTVTKLNDQHAFIALTDGAHLAVGDLVGFGISHPCTSFQLWREALVIDDADTIIDVYELHF